MAGRPAKVRDAEREPEQIITTHVRYRGPVEIPDLLTIARRHMAKLNKPEPEPDPEPEVRINGVEPGYTKIDVERVIRGAKSGKAYLMLIEGDEQWVPRSVLRHRNAVMVGRYDVEVEIATWFAKKQGWATT